MSTEDKRSAQRAEWKRALAAAAAIQRSGRHRRKPPRRGVGMLRRAPEDGGDGEPDGEPDGADGGDGE